MSETRQTQEIVRLPGAFSAVEAAEYRDALEAAGISCQLANETSGPQTGVPVVLWIRGDDLQRAQALVKAHRASAAHRDNKG